MVLTRYMLIFALMFGATISAPAFADDTQTKENNPLIAPFHLLAL